jgi:branched-chain amino acid transport system substrate-binding protein
MPAKRLALAVSLVLVASACGTRLPIDTSRAIAEAPGQAGSSGLDSQSETVTQSQGTGDAGTTQRAAAAGPRIAGGNAPRPAGGNGGATDVGITGNEIRVGNVSAIGGPLPGQFRPMAEAVQAYFRLVNERGGVYGRRLTLVGCDDELNGQKRQACLRSLVEDKHVFAFVGNLSAADEGDAAYLDGALKGAVPDVGGFALAYSHSNGSFYWSPMGALRRELAGTAQWEWIRAQTHFTKPVVFWHNINISREQGQTLLHELAVVTGVRDDQIRNYEVSPTVPDFNSQVLQAKQQGYDSFFTSMEISSNIRLVRAIANYRDPTWNPTIHFELSTYTQDFLEALGPLAKGVYIRIPHTPFSEPAFAPMAEYLQTLKRFFPASAPASFGVFGWVGAAFFVDALKKAGPNLTRAKLYDAMKTRIGASPFTAGGLIGANENIRSQPFYCHVIAQVTDEGGKLDFRRVSAPGFNCSKTFKWRDPFVSR